MIHPSAVVHPKAVVDPSVVVGPCAVIDEGVVIGKDCVIGPNAYLTGRTILGVNNRVHSGCVIGSAPQDLKYKGEPTSVHVGDHNTFREHVTVNRSTRPGGATIIGSHNLLMTGCHVGHDSILGNHVVLVNGSLLGGFVVIEDGCVISAYCLLHQFVRVGTLAFMQGGAGISKDLPPYCLARGHNDICGLNVVGLRRAGLTAAQRLDLRKLYMILFRSGHKLIDALSIARDSFPGEHTRVLIDFVQSSKRGVCLDTGKYRRDSEFE